MAVVSDQKVLNIAAHLVDLSDRIMVLIDEARAVKEEKEGCGYDLTTPANEALFAASVDLKHVDGTLLDNVISSFAALDTWSTANFHTSNWQQARK